MSFTPRQAEVRFGCGLSPSVAPPATLPEMLDRLTGADQAAAAHPIEGWSTFATRVVAYRAARKARGSDGSGDDALKEIRVAARQANADWIGQMFLRRAVTRDGFRERLTAFWADHFTAIGRGNPMLFGQLPYVEDTIRPRLTGRFADLLRAVATAPLMLHYLDQASSMGPDSVVGLKRRKGANENLARELLELHTLGVGAGYGQGDVTELAHLLTGLGISAEAQFVYRPGWSEPGAETVLGVSYGSEGPGRLDDIYAALDDLAARPETAQHLARKLAVHFVADEPDAGLVEAMAAAYRDTDGALLAVYRAMLEHPAAWQGAGTIKTPVDFVGSALRGLGVRDLPMRRTGRMMALLANPLELMGQPWRGPDGPDGWPEADGDWITPQRLAGRLQWALNVPGVLADPLPDPRDFVGAVLAGDVPDTLRFAARAAETREEGIALILSSPAFQRM